ncbi:hypothetical protein GCM10009539_75270 [Cryptosporangium japonicum]|uniref:Uncharacterized protein n=1 Tax=Cryptosporangium japonicum TaxID=80872 RepID=A0ABP3EVD8_9ACTN
MVGVLEDPDAFFHLCGGFDDRQALHREAVDAVSRLDVPERDDYRLVFGQTSVAIWNVGLAVELQDGAAALAAGDQVRPPADYVAPERVGLCTSMRHVLLCITGTALVHWRS